MQCPSCHQETSGAFCSFCGATLAAAPAGASPGAAAPAVPVATAGTGLSENAAAAIAYLTIIPSILFLLLDPYRRMPLVRFHSIQNIALAIAWAIVWTALTFVHVTLLHMIPFVGALFFLVDMAVVVGFFIAWLMALIKASRGEFFKLPVIGDFAAKMANN